MNGHIFQFPGELGKKHDQLAKIICKLRDAVIRDCDPPQLIYFILVQMQNTIIIELGEPSETTARMVIFRWASKMKECIQDERALK